MTNTMRENVIAYVEKMDETTMKNTYDTAIKMQAAGFTLNEFQLMTLTVIAEKLAK